MKSVLDLSKINSFDSSTLSTLRSLPSTGKTIYLSQELLKNSPASLNLSGHVVRAYISTMPLYEVPFLGFKGFDTFSVENGIIVCYHNRM